MRVRSALGILTDRLARVVTDAEQQIELPDGVTYAELLALRAIKVVGSQGVAALAERLGISGAAASIVLSQLRRDGLVLVARREGQKSLTIMPTTKGVSMLRAAERADIEVLQLALGSLGEDARKCLVSALVELDQRA